MGKKTMLLLVVSLMMGCGLRTPHTIAPDYAKKQTRLVAVLPVENKANDAVAARMLREKILEELYYKGYPKIPLELIDMVLLKLAQDSAKSKGNVSPLAVGEFLKVDAVISCTLQESKTMLHYLYAPTSVSASCELRSVKTGERLWQAGYHDVERSFGYSPFDAKTKAVELYEAAIQKIINRVMETLPDGPDLAG